MKLREILAKYDAPENTMQMPHECERCGMLCKSLRGLRIHQKRSSFCHAPKADKEEENEE